MKNSFKLPMLLDGATGTNLIRAGMPQGICTEQWILENPDVLTGLQREYAKAGCDAVMAPTFETNRYKLANFGFGDKVAEFSKRLVALSKEAVGGNVLVAGDISPTGLMIEPFGDTTFDELVDLFREQAFALKDAGADYIAAETMMSLTEARAALLAAKETGLPVTVTLTVDKKGRTLSGGDVTACLVTLAAMGADAVGLNCSTGPQIILEQLREAAPCLHVPLVAKPNAGLPIEGRPGEYDISPKQFAAYTKNFLACGVGLAGGCCGTTPEHIALMRAELDKAQFRLQNGDDGTNAEGVREFLAADERHTFLVTEENMEFSHKIACDAELADNLINVADEGYVAARIRIKNTAEATEFAQNAYLCTLPVVLLCDDAEALDMALRLYQGRAMVDSKSDLPLETLKKFSGRYGSVII